MLLDLPSAHTSTTAMATTTVEATQFSVVSESILHVWRSLVLVACRDLRDGHCRLHHIRCSDSPSINANVFLPTVGWISFVLPFAFTTSL